MHTSSQQQLYTEFGDRVRRRRTELGVLQSEVARRMGLSRASISNLEAGRQHPQLHQVYEIAGILQVEVGALLPQPTSDPDQSRHDDIRALVIAAASE
jgi:transcriptional regulator with XRE-family HTH domain